KVSGGIWHKLHKTLGICIAFSFGIIIRFILINHMNESLIEVILFCGFFYVCFIIFRFLFSRFFIRIYIFFCLFLIIYVYLFIYSLLDSFLYFYLFVVDDAHLLHEFFDQVVGETVCSCSVVLGNSYCAYFRLTLT